MDNKKLLYRHGVFETNSSSCHSLSLHSDANQNNLFDDFYIHEDGKLFFYTDEYGWGMAKLDSFGEKLSYVMTYCITNYRYEDFMFVLKILHDVTQFQSLYYEDNLLVGTWDDDAEQVKFANDFDLYNFFKYVNDDTYSYIDHQSIDLLDDVIKDEEKLKSLLFCKESYITTDNDNH